MRLFDNEEDYDKNSSLEIDGKEKKTNKSTNFINQTLKQELDDAIKILATRDSEIATMKKQSKQ